MLTYRMYCQDNINDGLTKQTCKQTKVLNNGKQTKVLSCQPELGNKLRIMHFLNFILISHDGVRYPPQWALM